MYVCVCGGGEVFAMSFAMEIRAGNIVVHFDNVSVSSFLLHRKAVNFFFIFFFF